MTGGPGIGKSSLAGSIAAEAADRGFRLGRGAWDADEAPPLSGWHQALGEALGSAEALRMPTTDQTDVASTTYRLGGALLDALRSAGPTLLVLDDMHWADSDSLRLLRRCTSALPSLPLVLVVTTRDSAADVGPDTERDPGLAGALGPGTATADWTGPSRRRRQGTTAVWCLRGRRRGRGDP